MAWPIINNPRRDRVRELNDLLRRCEAGGRRQRQDVVSSGCRALDRRLPAGGLARATLVEWLSDGPGCGANLLMLAAAREACRQGGALVIVEREEKVYPPALAAAKIDLESTIVVRPDSEKDYQWAVDQSLQCSQAAAVIAWPRRIESSTFRRWQLAAETSGCLGLLMRPAAARGESSWADVRLLVTPQASQDGWRLQLEILKCRGRASQNKFELEIDDRTGEFHEASAGHLAAQLAHPASREHSA